MSGSNNICKMGTLRWKYEKREFTTSGLEINELLLNTISKNFKIHLYNIYLQYSELNPLGPKIC